MYFHRKLEIALITPASSDKTCNRNNSSGQRIINMRLKIQTVDKSPLPPPPPELKLCISHFVWWEVHTFSTSGTIYLTLKAFEYFRINHGDQRFFPILNHHSCFIWIPMLWVYGHYKYLYSYIVGVDFSRQNLTSTDVRSRRLKSIPAL